MNARIQKPKQWPQRSCCSCRKKGTVDQFLRITWDPDAGPQLDESMKRPGRGTYVCPGQRCLEQALKKGALARALHKQWTVVQANIFLKNCMARISENSNAEEKH
jgi:uncharacterized protein